MLSPLVTIEQGVLQGYVGTDLRGNPFYKFQGIPYAKPPIGELRFKSPVEPEKWTGVLDATKEGDESKQRDPFKKYIVTGSENCLKLNVFTKKLPENQNEDLRPVMFYIHGGGLIFGSSKEEWYGPEFLLTEDIVLVTINYRLGLLGFLSFEDPSLEIPGNAGLKDQVMALKWVQKNISKFGGDPNNVTIFGESAGGASVHCHVLSPLSKGLFHKAISQSGCALNPWVEAKNVSKILATVMNLESDDKTIYQALLTKTEDEIMEIQDKLNDTFDPVAPRVLGLVIEKNSKDAFMPDEPVKMILSRQFNQVPYMLGYTTCEGMIFDLFEKPEYKNTVAIERYVPWFFGYNASETKEAVNKIKKSYFGNGGFSLDKKYKLLSDIQFIYGLHVTALSQYHQSKAPLYLYRVTIESELNYFKKFLKTTHPGVSHLDDLGYLFKTQLTPEIKKGSLEDIAFTRMVKLWTNFGKFGNPTPDKNDSILKAFWKPVTGPNLDFLDIGEELVPMDKPDVERVAFWTKLFAESPAGRQTEFST